uniref:Ribonuclease A-domain domain-containing protein n=1 Tax=Astatotilapia calliptera TaxID=8154 RepID=A0AAX7VTX8_ASTCA
SNPHTLDRSGNTGAGPGKSIHRDAKGYCKKIARETRERAELGLTLTRVGNDNNGNCKRKNTFIIGDFNQVRTICDPSNCINANRNLYKSPTDIQMKRRIVIACDKINHFLQPVHFECCS